MKKGSCVLVFLQAVVLLAALSGARGVFGQSTSQDFPTPVTSNEITGEVRPRDLGDPRLTTHFYLVEAGQGDLFLNVATRNFSGDIDLFVLNGLRPLAKIVLYTDHNELETGRVVYLRKPERLLLRIHGRTPGDDAASYRIKFAGSFVASKETETNDPGVPKVAERGEGIRVNSVGTIIEQPVRRTAPVKDVAKDDTAREETTTAEVKEPERTSTAAESQSEAKVEKTEVDRPKVAVIVTEGTDAKPATEPAATRPRANPRNTTRRSRNNTAVNRRSRADRPAASRGEPEPDPLANIRLVVLFKDGSKIERPMSEVQRFNVDRGMLTVVSKDGKVGRYSILDVLKVTIE